MPGRRKTTGRFETRPELEKEIWWRWQNSKSTIADIARACRISQATVSKILDAKEVKWSTSKN